MNNYWTIYLRDIPLDLEINNDFTFKLGTYTGTWEIISNGFKMMFDKVDEGLSYTARLTSSYSEFYEGEWDGGDTLMFKRKNAADDLEWEN